MKRVLLFKERNNEKPALLWKSSLSSSLPPTSVRVILSLPPPALGASHLEWCLDPCERNGANGAGSRRIPGRVLSFEGIN